MKGKNSIYNAVSSIAFTLINGLFGIIVTKLVIEHYGSDFNGLNSTANQIINVLLIFEGGFTIASNVALFKPLLNNDRVKINDILFLTRNKFRKIGILVLVLGIIISFIYTLLVNSSLSGELVFTVIFMTVISTFFNLYYATTFRVLLQSDQREYIINLIMALCIGLGHLANIILVNFDVPPWLIRFTTMIFSLLSSILIGWYAKRKYNYISLVKRDISGIRIYGTKDVMIQKITGAIYNSIPIIFLSISSNAGTVIASVYAVYNSVFTLIKSLMRSIIDAPRHGFGLLVSKGDKEETWRLFKNYEYIAFIFIFIIVPSTYALIMPFMKIYMNGINDASYYDSIIALIMSLIAFVELIHIPSGHLINMAGKFREGKIFQLAACVMLIVMMPVGMYVFGLYGLLGALLVVALSLALMEIIYIHKFYFKKKTKEVVFLLLPFIVCGILLSIFEKYAFSAIDNIMSFIIGGLIIVLLNISVALIIVIIFNREFFRNGVNIIKNLKR